MFATRIEKLIASMSDRYILNPIIVNEKMEIIDGQGRFEARKAMKKPIHYIIVRGATSDDCRRMNKYNTVWTQLDYARSFEKCGNENYIRLLRVCEITHLTIARVLRLSNHFTKTKKATANSPYRMSSFESGELCFTESDAATVKQIKVAADEILEALQFTLRPNDAFYAGLKVCTETPGYEHDRMLRRCREERTSYSQMSNLANQLVEFERIYNKGLSAKNRLYFSDYMRNRGSSVRNYDNNYTAYEDVDISSLT